jgi:hypothetical protein
MQCVVVISGWKTATAGAIRAEAASGQGMAGSAAVCRALDPTDGRKAVQQLAAQLDETWKTVSRRFDCNDAVSIRHNGKYPS